PRCTSCDDIAVTDAASARAKAQCLKATWDGIETAASHAPTKVTPPPAQDPSGPGKGAYDLALRPKIARTARLLNELVGEHLPSTHRATTAKAYLREPNAQHACSHA